MRTDDGVRIRICIWRAKGPEAGRSTALILQGRSEYAEKYGLAIARLTARGHDCVAVDWRGQGLSDRPIPEIPIGHVTDFEEYQRDLRAMLAAAPVRALPGPRWILAHSMGGCIGLRALTEGFDVRAAVFSAPMWGIEMSTALKPVAITLGHLVPRLGGARLFAPGGSARSYVLRQPFEGNLLTTDAGAYARLRTHLTLHPSIGLGGPSFGWFGAALEECRALMREDPPHTPILTFVGTLERIVSPAAIRRQSQRQPNARLVEIPGARHELIVERPEVQERVWSEIGAFLARHLP